MLEAVTAIATATVAITGLAGLVLTWHQNRKLEAKENKGTAGQQPEQPPRDPQAG